jgi:rhodanese-related sulfurtransferase
MDALIAPDALRAALAQTDPPLLIDVRRAKAFSESADMITGALRRDPENAGSWSQQLPRAGSIVVYCVHGHEVSQNAASALRGCGLNAQYLDHGIEGWRQAGGSMQAKPPGASTRWVTRARPRIDRIACPWLIRRFVDANAAILYVPSAEVRAVAEREHAVAFDIPGAQFGHVDELCSFDAFLAHYRLSADPALDRLAKIVRAADTDRVQNSAQAPGLLALSIGLSRLYADDEEMLAQGMIMYDALYLWCRDGVDAAKTFTLNVAK